MTGLSFIITNHKFEYNFRISTCIVKYLFGLGSLPWIWCPRPRAGVCGAWRVSMGSWSAWPRGQSTPDPDTVRCSPERPARAWGARGGGSPTSWQTDRQEGKLLQPPWTPHSCSASRWPPAGRCPSLHARARQVLWGRYNQQTDTKSDSHTWAEAGSGRGLPTAANKRRLFSSKLSGKTRSFPKDSSTGRTD